MYAELPYRIPLIVAFDTAAPP